MAVAKRSFQCAFDRNGNVLVASSNKQDSESSQCGGIGEENKEKLSQLMHRVYVRTQLQPALEAATAAQWATLPKKLRQKYRNFPFIDSKALILSFMSVKRSEEGKEMVKFFLFPAGARRFSLIRLTQRRGKEEKKRERSNGFMSSSEDFG
jgi:hypothetical protein